MGLDDVHGHPDPVAAARLDPDAVVEFPGLEQLVVALRKEVESIAAVVARIDDRTLKTDEKIDQTFDHVVDDLGGLGKRIQIVEGVARQIQEKINEDD